MKNLFVSLLFSTLALAAPILEERQNTGITENEYSTGGCRDIIFFFARGSTEIGNMVSLYLVPILIHNTESCFRVALLAHQHLMD